MRTIIGISGKAGCGKDTFADYLVEIGWKKMGFADALKETCKGMFNFTDEQLNTQEGKRTIDPYWGITPRDAMLDVGTGQIRKYYDEDHWVKAAEQRILSYHGNIAFKDLRFKNEAELLRRHGAVLIRVERGGLNLIDHESETELDGYQFDVRIDNNGSLLRLKNQAILLDKVIRTPMVA